MKDSGIEWIGEISEDWEIFTLKKIVGRHFGGCWGEDAKGDILDALCIRIADFDFEKQNIKLTASTIRHYTTEQLNKGLLQDGDLIVEKSGGGEKTPVGRVVLFEKKYFPNKAMFANFSECLRLKSNVDKKYVAYHLKALYYAYDMHYYFNQTTGIQNLDISAYLSTALCCPPKDIQQRIADYLDKKCAAVERLMENQRLQIEKLKEYKQSLITEAVSKGLDKTVPLKSSGVEWIGDIPEGWKVCRIKDLFELRNERNYEELSKVNLISLYTELGVMQHSDIEETTGNKAVKAEGYKLVYKNDIVVNIILCWMGAVGKSNYNGVTSPAYDVYKPNSKASSDYYHYLFRTAQFNGECYRYGRGIMMMRWRTYSSEFRAISVPCPPLSEQQQIAEYLDKKCAEIDELISIKQQKIEKLTEYKKSLIYEYVTGKKEVV